MWKGRKPQFGVEETGSMIMQLVLEKQKQPRARKWSLELVNPRGSWLVAQSFLVRYEERASFSRSV